MSEIPTDLRWAYAIARMYVGRESADELTDRLEAAMSADFERWRENNERMAQDFSPIVKGIGIPSDVTSFILDHVLPLRMQRQSAKARKHEVLELVIALEPDEFIGLILLYAVRIEDRAGVGRAFDILMATSSPYKQRLKAYRGSSEGGRQKASQAKAERAVRDRRILERAVELCSSGKRERDIASILAKEFNLSSTHIRTIRRKSKR